MMTNPKGFPICRRPAILSAIAALAMLVSGCGDLVNPPTRLGMVKDPATGLQLGSVVERNFVTDASFFENRRIKVRIRNISGDQAFDLYEFKSRLETSYQQAGYRPTSDDDFGLLIDVNVRYSGQVQTNLSRQFGFLGASAGGLAGVAHGGGVAAAGGTVAGATLGSILGSYITDDTYIIVAEVTVGLVKGNYRRDGKRITFSRSLTGDIEEQEEREERRRRRGFKSTHRTNLSVFAGGRNVTQAEIAGQVRSRLVRIIRDII
jgi:hypothetical protein